MRIFIDNEKEDGRRIVNIQDKEKMSAEKIIDTFLVGLQGMGYNNIDIQKAFLIKVIEWGYINMGINFPMGEEDASI